MNYRGHSVANIVVLGTTCALLEQHTEISPPLLISYAAGFCLGTIWLSPDLDLSHSRSNRNWGFLRFIWWPYSLVFKHRGLSHSVLFSTLTRLIYLGLILFACCAISDFSLSLDELGPLTQNCALAGLGGIFGADISHIVLDRASSALRRLF